MSENLGLFMDCNGIFGVDGGVHAQDNPPPGSYSPYAAEVRLLPKVARLDRDVTTDRVVYVERTRRQERHIPTHRPLEALTPFLAIEGSRLTGHPQNTAASSLPRLSLSLLLAANWSARTSAGI
jgi:hypothetical protein